VQAEQPVAEAEPATATAERPSERELRRIAARLAETAGSLSVSPTCPLTGMVRAAQKPKVSCHLNFGGLVRPL
jgi:hypothetical protein